MSNNRILSALPLTLVLLIVCGTGWAQRPTPTPTPIPQNVLQMVERGNEAFQKGHLDEAMSTYRSAIQQAPTLAEAHYRMGVALIYRERYVEAEQSLSRALQLDPAMTPARNLLTKHAEQIAAAKAGPTQPEAANAPIQMGTPETVQPGSAPGGAMPPGFPAEMTQEQLEAYMKQFMAAGIIAQIALLLLWILSIAICVWQGPKRGHGLVWSILYGFFCSCCGIVLIFLPPKVSKILFIVVVVLWLGMIVLSVVLPLVLAPSMTEMRQGAVMLLGRLG